MLNDRFRVTTTSRAPKLLPYSPCLSLVTVTFELFRSLDVTRFEMEISSSSSLLSSFEIKIFSIRPNFVSNFLCFVSNGNFISKVFARMWRRCGKVSDGKYWMGRGENIDFVSSKIKTTRKNTTSYIFSVIQGSNFKLWKIVSLFDFDKYVCFHIPF